MSIFGKIMSAIFGDSAAAAPGGAAAPAPATTAGAGTAPAPTAPQPTAAPSVDVAPILDKAVKAKGEKLEWRTSIVDLMKLLSIDSDFDSRKALAQELGRPDYSGSAEDNVWLHRQVMNELSRNGGKVPAEFID